MALLPTPTAHTTASKTKSLPTPTCPRPTPEGSTGVFSLTGVNSLYNLVVFAQMCVLPDVSLAHPPPRVEPFHLLAALLALLPRAFSVPAAHTGLFSPGA